MRQARVLNIVPISIFVFIFLLRHSKLVTSRTTHTIADVSLDSSRPTLARHYKLSLNENLVFTNLCDNRIWNIKKNAIFFPFPYVKCKLIVVPMAHQAPQESIEHESHHLRRLNNNIIWFRPRNSIKYSAHFDSFPVLWISDKCR